MSKDPKPMGPKKYKKTLKKQFTNSLKKYAQQLEGELQAVYKDPNTTIGKLANAYNGSQTANERLSALCACLIKAAGGKIKFTKEELESFKGMAINIKWELPEGIAHPEDADSFIFTYDAIPQSELEKQQTPSQVVQPPVVPTDSQEAPPAPAIEDSTFVAADNPTEVIPSGTAFPDEEVSSPATEPTKEQVDALAEDTSTME